MLRIRHHHCSGRWDRPAAALRHDVLHWVKTFDPDIMTATECGDGGRGKAYDVDGYNRIQALPSEGRDECVIAYKLDKYRMVTWDSFKVSDLCYKRTNGKEAAPFFATTVVLEDVRSNERVLFSVMHLPSSVEDGDGWDNGQRLRVYLSCVRGWRKHINQMGKKYHARRRFLVADWNINFKRVFARAFVKAQFPNLSITWKAPFPVRGTHAGARLIDATLVSKGVRVVEEPRIGAPAKSSDHTMYFEVLAA